MQWGTKRLVNFTVIFKSVRITPHFDCKELNFSFNLLLIANDVI